MRKIISKFNHNYFIGLGTGHHSTDRSSLLAGQAINLIVLRGRVTDKTIALNLA